MSVLLRLLVQLLFPLLCVQALLSTPCPHGPPGAKHAPTTRLCPKMTFAPISRLKRCCGGGRGGVSALTAGRAGNQAAEGSTSTGVLPCDGTGIKVVIAGGGPAGGLLALALAKRNFSVSVYETLTDEEVGLVTERSYNIVLTTRAEKALASADVDIDEFVQSNAALRIEGNIRRQDGKGKVSRRVGSSSLAGGVSMSRGALAAVLLQKAKAYSDAVIVHYGRKLKGVDLSGRKALFESAEGQEGVEAYDLLIGADGVNSAVRTCLEEEGLVKTRKVRDFKSFKTFRSIPVKDMINAQEGDEALFNVFQCADGDLLCPPRPDGTLSATCILNGEGGQSFEALTPTEEDLRTFLHTNYPSAFGPGGPAPEFIKELHAKRPMTLTSVYCDRWAAGNVVLVGDAASAMWASLGQGVNCALEGSRVLVDTLDRFGGGRAPSGLLDVLPTALQAFSDEHGPDGRAATLLSERGMGGSGNRSAKWAFLTRIISMVLLNKTAPWIFPKPAMMSLYDADMKYSSILAASEKEERVFFRLFKAFAAGVSALLCWKAFAIVRPALAL